MNKAKTLLTALAFSAVIPMAQAEIYLGGNYLYLDYSEEYYYDDLELDLGALYLRGGYQFADWAAVEVRVGTGVSDDTVNEFGINVDVELEELYGAYFIAGIPNSSLFYPYAVAGYTRAEMDVSAWGFSESASESDFSYGLGTDIRFSENFAANIEFMRYMDKDGVEVDGLSAGIKYTFK